MTVFVDYAAYYDALYAQKAYPAETNYMAELIRQHRPKAKTLLDLGCGTGKHAAEFSDQGFKVSGIDLSQTMIEIAQQRYEAKGIQFECGDIRDFNLNQKFDVCYSLFHVMSYQTRNQDLEAVFANVKQHLAPGGLFMFDAWYGPAVLLDLPQPRIKTIQYDRVEVTRFANPEIDFDQNIVDVHYKMFVHDHAADRFKIIEETHPMRYLFTPEVQALCDKMGFQWVGGYEFMTQNPPAPDQWSVLYIAQL